MVDLGDKKQVKDRKTSAQAIRADELDDIKYLLGEYKFRSFIWRLVAQCGIYSSAPRDPVDMSRAAGKEDIGLWLISEILDSHPQGYSLIRDEAVAREVKDN